ncbi:hypothetical protein AMECASPLE_039735 [Ameca splendens]|uniref:Uncharacterized protein n=1 Tax=Ameca splendens TaxID=208324 RepID=A0ABV1AFK8_9TELE
MVHALSEILTKLSPASSNPPVCLENPQPPTTPSSGIREPDFRPSELFDVTSRESSINHSSRRQRLRRYSLSNREGER